MERSDVEHASGCRIRDVAVADAIQALQAAAKGKVEITGSKLAVLTESL